MATCRRKYWREFKLELPHQRLPYSKKNWGNQNHSLCSYQGKLKPAIAYHLVKAFVPKGGKMFDPFAGVGTIPFEAALNGKMSYGMDISIMAYIISLAKIGKSSYEESIRFINELNDYIVSHQISTEEYNKYSRFGFNKSLKDYYEDNTFKEILLARRFIIERGVSTANASEMVVIAALMHILHGNRPYALSRRSHPIVPYAPTGDFVYKSVVRKVTDKVEKFYLQELPKNFKCGKMFLQDSTETWPDEIQELDSIITSPPFYDSTRFYVANWIRLWFSGWEPKDFEEMPEQYIDERQQIDMGVYEPIFEQARERLKRNGTLVFHLGKSKKCDMGEILQTIGHRYFTHSELFSESVEHCAKFGIKDLGTVTDHEYLVLW